MVTVSATETKTAIIVPLIVEILRFVAQGAILVQVAANVAPTSATQEEERANKDQILGK